MNSFGPTIQLVSVSGELCSQNKEFTPPEFHAELQQQTDVARLGRGQCISPSARASGLVQTPLWEITVMSPSSQIEGKRLDRRSAPQSPSEVPLWDVRERAAPTPLRSFEPGRYPAISEL